MIILEPKKIGTFENYLNSLSKRARHEYGLVCRRNHDLLFEPTEFNLDKFRQFMGIWGGQLVRGKPIEWAYPVETVANWADQGHLRVYEVRNYTETLGMHFLRREDGFWDAQPPMWDKQRLSFRHLGTFIWFHTIKYAIKEGLDIFNLGGGLEAWRENIRRRKEFTNPKYKWRFVPQAVKKNPDSQPNYFIEPILDHHFSKTIILKS